MSKKQPPGKAKCKIVHLFPHFDVAAGLRNLAEQIDAGDFHGDSCTLVLDCAAVFHFGKDTDDTRCMEEALFDMHFGIQRIMAPTIENVRHWEKKRGE